MKIVAISDTHWKFKEIEIPKCDIVLHAGDVSGRGTKEEIIEFLDWYADLPADNHVMIAGNHDFGFELWPEWCEKQCSNRGIIYLNDSGVKIRSCDSGEFIKIYGSPVQPAFFDWAFNRARTEESSKNIFNKDDYGKEPIKTHWDKIPEDVDILITHGPPYGILDQCKHGERVGCKLLAKKVKEIKPKMHIFGHIHEARGIDKVNNITYINASSLNLKYNVYERPYFVFDWNNIEEIGDK